MSDTALDILAALEQRARERHEHAKVCHSDRSRKHMQIRADEAGQLVAIAREILRKGTA